MPKKKDLSLTIEQVMDQIAALPLKRDEAIKMQEGSIVVYIPDAGTRHGFTAEQGFLFRYIERDGECARVKSVATGDRVRVKAYRLRPVNEEQP